MRSLDWDEIKAIADQRGAEPAREFAYQQFVDELAKLTGDPVSGQYGIFCQK
jgi:hypothetical protein